jgi:hypothetical protein
MLWSVLLSGHVLIHISSAHPTVHKSWRDVGERIGCRRTSMKLGALSSALLAIMSEAARYTKFAAAGP